VPGFQRTGALFPAVFARRVIEERPASPAGRSATAVIQQVYRL
jgi:hypothetical protein